MFKDTDEELSRLSSELLKEEDESEEEYEEEYDEGYEDSYEEEDVFPEYDYEDTRAAQDPVVYQNYSNGYRAYNSDDCDEDLDAFSEDVYEAEEERGNTGLVILACVLASMLALVMLFMVLKYKGVL